MFIKEPTSNEFHSQGLFSEDIFGQVGSTDRLISYGYIDLRTQVFHPTIYGHLLRLKALYGQILSSKTYARFDKEEEDLVACSENDEGAGTGFKFFLDNFKKIKFKKNASDEETVDALAKVWRNFVVSDVFEPGSTYKTFTIAGALEEAVVDENYRHVCDGGEQIDTYYIQCHIASYDSVHGELTLSGALENSCNDVLMDIAKREGPATFDKYQKLPNYTHNIIYF
mgnify:CR=1 FL=1